MKNRVIAIAAAAILLIGAAQAHTHLHQSMPADKSSVSEAPKQLMLHFSEPTRLTALSLQKEGDAQATTIESLPTTPSPDITVPLSPLAAGKYLVNWRAVGKDNHVMNGKLEFTVQAK